MKKKTLQNISNDYLWVWQIFKGLSCLLKLHYSLCVPVCMHMLCLPTCMHALCMSAEGRAKHWGSSCLTLYLTALRWHFSLYWQLVL